MSLAASSTRIPPGTSFEKNNMYNRKPIFTKQNTMSPAAQIFQIPPTPAVEFGARPMMGNLPVTPAPRKQDIASSPSSGYFGLSRNDADNGDGSWSPASSLKSAAARSPMVLDLDSLPPTSEDFKRQSNALAAHSLNLAEKARVNSVMGNERREENTPPPPRQSILSPDFFSQSHNTQGNEYNFTKGLTPAAIDNHQFLNHTRASSCGTNFTLPAKLNGPVSGSIDRSKDNITRSASLPECSQVDGISLILGAKLVNLMQQCPNDILLLDLRPYQQYAVSRIKQSLNLAIPTTLLKRPSFNMAKLAECLGTPRMKEQLSRWKDAKYIIAYDASSEKVQDSATASHTINKFIKEGWSGEASLLSGGFEIFEEEFPNWVDDGNISENPKAAKSLSLSAKTGLSMKPSFNCPLPDSKNACNPFFSNIRQNMDLIGGVGEMPIHLPGPTTEKSKEAFPSWLKEVACQEDGSKKVSQRFYNIEKAEQQRMQEALSCSVTYGNEKANEKKSHTLAGVEKGTKNRYNNIWPYDHSRVKLKEHNPDDCDYINASYITTEFSSKRYIATQGPLPTTFQDFWSVVWDQDVRVIVMLTAEAEGGQLKCHSYWNEQTYGPYILAPLSTKRVTIDPDRTHHALQKSGHPVRPHISKTQDKVQLESPPDQDSPHIIMRKFTLSHTGKPFQPIREITQLQFAAWPDFGTPASPANVLGLIEQVDAVVKASAASAGGRASTTRGSIDRNMTPLHTPRPERPVLVHCSAGCGRTGVFCATDSVIDMLKHQKDLRASSTEVISGNMASNSDGSNWVEHDDMDLVEKAVNDLRDQRISMVQCLRQYVLCYETVLEWLVRRPLTESPNLVWNKSSA